MQQALPDAFAFIEEAYGQHAAGAVAEGNAGAQGQRAGAAGADGSPRSAGPADDARRAPGGAAAEGVKFSREGVGGTAADRLNAAVEQWKAVVESYLDRTLDRTKTHILLPATPASMQALSMPDLEVRIGMHALDYANVRLTRAQLEDLPRQLAGPQLVYMHDGQDGPSINFVTEHENSSGMIVAALRPNQKVRGREVQDAHFVVTLLNVPYNRILGEVRNGNALLVGASGMDLPRLKGALLDAKRNNGRQAREVRASLARSYGLTSIPTNVVYPSTVVNMVTQGRALFSRAVPPQATAAESTVKEVMVPAARRTAEGYARKVNYALLFGHQLVDRIGAMLPSTRAFFRTLQDRITVRDRREARVMEIADRFYRLDRAEQARANRFIYESTSAQKWGYAPEWDRSVAVDTGMAAQFNKLSADAQLAVKQVFAYGNETQREYEQVLLRTKGAEIGAQLAEAEAAGDVKRIAALRKEQEKLTRENGALKTVLAGPYAPLKRFGRHAVVVRSQTFMDAEASGDGARVEAMQPDPDHYQVMFVDSVFEREKKVVELQREFPGRNVVGFEREPENTRATELPLQAIKRLQEAIITGPNGEKLSERSRRILGRIASDLYVASLDSLSARQTQQRRRNIHGANEDMMRAFVSQGRGMAHMLATLEVNGPMQESLQAMRTEARTGRTAEKADALNEVLNRYTLLMESRPTPFQDGAMAATSIWMLLTNPAYWFGNATQPFMMSLPVLAGRHNAGASWSAVLQGYRDTMPALVGRALDPKKLKAVVGREADAMQELLDRGHIDLTLEREMGEISNSSWHAGHKAMNLLRFIPQRVEVTNRVATALAAYRLEYVRATGQGMDAATAHGAATEYADQIILDTHGDYSAAGAPRVLMQGNTQMPVKLMGQFRKFQLVQLGLMSKLIRQSFSEGMSPDERTAARWSLAWMLGTFLTMTGLTGMIGANVVWGIVSAFGDDDEKDLDLVLTRALGDRDAAILLTRGVPALLGVDVSQRLGMGNVLSVFPYADTEPAVKDSYTNYLMAATGPFLGGLLPRAAAGVDYINQGDYWKGLELLVPNGLTNAMRAVRYADEGFTNRKGDLLMTPDEIGVLGDIFQAAGLPTTVLTDRQWKAGALYELEQTLRSDATRIKRQYTEAARSRDTEAMAELRGEWRQLQEVRARNGMKPQPLSTLLKAPQQQRSREERVDDGVALTASAAGFIATVPD
jgi:hypothetical protein